MRDRRDGPGSIVRLPDGAGGVPRYRARIRIRGEVHSKTLPRKDPLRSWLRVMREKKILEESRPGEAIRGTRQDVTFEDLREELLADWKSGRRRAHTPGVLRAYASQWKHVLDVWGPREVRETTSAAVDRYVAELREAGLSTSTIRHRLDRLAQAIALAVRRRYILAAPCRVERPRLVLSSRPRAIAEEPLRRLLERAADLEDPRPRLVLLLAASAGLRREEVLRLRVEDVALEDTGTALGWIHVAVESEAERPKSARARRVPILDRALADALRAAVEDRPSRARVVEGISTVDGILYQAEKAWRGIIPGRPRLHELRRRFATRLHLAGVPLRQIQSWLGHADLETTSRYLDVPIEPSASARRAFEDVS